MTDDERLAELRQMIVRFTEEQANLNDDIGEAQTEIKEILERQRKPKY